MVCMADLLSHEELKCTLMTRVLQLAIKNGETLDACIDLEFWRIPRR
jgi:hypothetical protein